MPEPIDFFNAVVTGYPIDADHAPLLQDTVHARVARAGDVADGDLVLAAVSPAEPTTSTTSTPPTPSPTTRSASAACAATSPTNPAP